MMVKAQKQPESMSYEEALAELERIVQALEKEQVNLDESISLYERGQVLVNHCAQLLEKAELKLEQLKTELPEVDDAVDDDEVTF